MLMTTDLSVQLAALESKVHRLDQLHKDHVIRYLTRHKLRYT